MNPFYASWAILKQNKEMKDCAVCKGKGCPTCVKKADKESKDCGMCKGSTCEKMGCS